MGTANPLREKGGGMTIGVWGEMDSEDECTERVETADEVMGHPEVGQVLHRLRRIEVMKDMGCPPRVMQTEYRLLWQEEVAAGRRIVS